MNLSSDEVLGVVFVVGILGFFGAVAWRVYNDRVKAVAAAAVGGAEPAAKAEAVGHMARAGMTAEAIAAVLQVWDGPVEPDDTVGDKRRAMFQELQDSTCWEPGEIEKAVYACYPLTPQEAQRG